MTLPSHPFLLLVMTSLATLLQVDAFSIGRHGHRQPSALFTNKPTWPGDKGEASYSDDWLLNFHNQEQKEMQLTTNSLEVWNERQAQEQASIREWQESFQRNGVADFTPPMSYGLNCLMVGGDISTEAATAKETKLPWENEAEADITSLEVIVPDKMASSSLPESQDSDIIQTRLVSDSPASTTQAGLRVLSKEAAVYDCIVDQGLMGSVLLTENNEETVKELLFEASLALREHGIYVLNTQKLTPETIELLQSYSQEAGLEWQFELDGISDATAQVSVARRFNTGSMPKVGRLSRYQP